MSFKSLTMLTLGRLKRGGKKTLTMLTLGRLREDDEKLKRKGAGDTFVQPGITTYEKYSVQSNNNVIILTEAGVF